jgi:glyoxalase family protein
MHGIHHITAISGNPSRNVGFYAQILGLRLIKKTVNFDDPGTYHLYYGDEAGSPGTILTFFPWEHAAPGSGGSGIAHSTTLRVPAASIAYWAQRFAEKGVEHEPPTVHFGENLLAFRDADGMSLALVGVAGAENSAGWSIGAIAAEHAIRGVHGVMLLGAAATAAVLTDVLGFKKVAREGGDVRYRANGGVGGIVDIRETAEGAPTGRMGRGSVHHVAFRAADDVAQAEMANRLVANHGLRPTGQKDRQYFRSIYFHEPGGVLFEIATDGPGFTVDEPLADLGKNLKLPSFLPRARQRRAKSRPSPVHARRNFSNWHASLPGGGGAGPLNHVRAPA